MKSIIKYFQNLNLFGKRKEFVYAWCKIYTENYQVIMTDDEAKNRKKISSLKIYNHLISDFKYHDILGAVSIQISKYTDFGYEWLYNLGSNKEKQLKVIDFIDKVYSIQLDHDDFINGFDNPKNILKGDIALWYLSSCEKQGVLLYKNHTFEWHRHGADPTIVQKWLDLMYKDEFLSFDQYNDLTNLNEESNNFDDMNEIGMYLLCKKHNKVYMSDEVYQNIKKYQYILE